MHTKKTTGLIALALIIGFGAGYLLHPASASPLATGGTGMMRPGGMRGGNGAMGGFLTGTVAAADASSITLTTRDGSSHVVLLTPATTVAKSVSGSVSDVSVGTTVVVTGTTNTDGSLSAMNIQLRPTPTQIPPATPAQ